MQAELERAQLGGERFPGVLWTELPAGEQATLYSEVLNEQVFYKPLVNGEKGCYASHLAVWRWLLGSTNEAVVVLEDDVRLERGFADVIRAISELPSTWEMIKLIGRPAIGRAEKLRAREPLCPGFELVRYQRLPSLTAGYVVNRKGAAKLLQTRVPFGRPVDVDLRHWWECQELLVSGVSPAPIALDDTSAQSSIGAKFTEQGLWQKWRKARFLLAYSLNNACRREP
jgi:glycosyl transferase family 25